MINQLEQKIALRDKLTARMQKEAREEHEKRKAHEERQMYLQEFGMRPKIALPLKDSEWEFKRVVIHGTVVPDQGRALSLISGEDGSIVVSTVGGEELTR